MQLFTFTVLNTCLIYCQILKGYIGIRTMQDGIDVQGTRWNSSYSVKYKCLGFFLGFLEFQFFRKNKY